MTIEEPHALKLIRLVISQFDLFRSLADQSQHGTYEYQVLIDRLDPLLDELLSVVRTYRLQRLAAVTTVLLYQLHFLFKVCGNRIQENRIKQLLCDIRPDYHSDFHSVMIFDPVYRKDVMKTLETLHNIKDVVDPQFVTKYQEQLIPDLVGSLPPKGTTISGGGKV